MVVIVVGSIGLTGCESDSSSGIASSSSATTGARVTSAQGLTSTTRPEAVRTARDLALTAAELPAGATVADFEMDEDTVRAVINPLTGVRSSGSTVQPAECATVVSMFDKPVQIEASDAGVVAGGAGRGATFTEVVLNRRPDIAAVSARFRRCASVRESVDVQPAPSTAPAPLTIKYNVLDGFRSRADELVVVDEAPEDSISQQRALLAYARVGDYGVFVRLRTSQGRSVDRGLFDRLLTASINKVIRAG